ncbi:MAG: phage/plasmid primase, P4 family [Desulfobacterales bacterium]
MTKTVKMINTLEDQARPFFERLFGTTLEDQLGVIEIRSIPPNYMKAPLQSSFHNTIEDAMQISFQSRNAGYNVYFGVNPRDGNGGGKGNIKNCVAHHVDIDYGKSGHKKGPGYLTYEEALSAIDSFPIAPTLIVHSGGGFHLYYVLDKPAEITDISEIEAINKGLAEHLGGDPGTQDITRILRVPGTYNFKQKDNARPVELIKSDGPVYSSEELELYKTTATKSATKPKIPEKPKKLHGDTTKHAGMSQFLDLLAVSDSVKELIQNGNNGKYQSRSEADMAVVMALVDKGYDFDAIKKIFAQYPIGDKYRGHNAPDKYLQHTIQVAKSMSDLTEEERQDPLFINGALAKKDGKYYLKTLEFQKYITDKYHFKLLKDTADFYLYNDYCYEPISFTQINAICQGELKDYRKLFSRTALNDFLHYAAGSCFISEDRTQKDQLRYMSMQNGIFDFKKWKLIPHTPDIFTLNRLPYKYDSKAECPVFLRFLEDIFFGNSDIIEFLQEAVGYIFHRTIPKPAMFFLIGGGSNGKTVLLKTIENLIGEDNVCSVSLNDLQSEYYVANIHGKMANLSHETPQNRLLNTDIVKAIVSGDSVSGRNPYDPVGKFKPYAKHFFAMNRKPEITDPSHGMWRRIYPIEFPRTFSGQEMNENLLDEILEELPGIFNWAFEGYSRLKSNSFKFKQVANIDNAKAQLKNYGNSVSAFENECLKRHKGNKEKFKMIYEYYTTFCSQEGYDQELGKNKFKAELKSSGYKIENDTTMNNQLTVYDVALSV